MKEPKKFNVNNVLTILFFITFLAVIGSTWYSYLYTKNFDYLVEAPCDTNNEKCFYRDCENEPDSCPPNGLSNYKQFYIKAYDFPQCSDNSCAQECETGMLVCKPIECNESQGDSCGENGN